MEYATGYSFIIDIIPQMRLSWRSPFCKRSFLVAHHLASDVNEALDALANDNMTNLRKQFSLMRISRFLSF